jgi:hypothetical protein
VFEYSFGTAVELRVAVYDVDTNTGRLEEQDYIGLWIWDGIYVQGSC